MSKQILVIDDDAGIRESFVLALKDSGYKVDTAETGEKGIDMELNHKYDRMLLGLKMPGIEGY